jgi:hypothetical protein
MAKRRQIQIEVPEYLTLGDYLKINEYKGDDNFAKLVHIVSSLTNQPKDEVERWDGRTLMKVGKMISDKANPQHEYHPLIEWNGILYGYRNIEKYTLGEYADMERLSKDPENNMAQIAALMYRPVTKHSFDTLSFQIKQSLKMVNNKVENVFDYYDVEDYDSQVRKINAEVMKDFPVHIVLGAMAFFLTTVNQYLHDSLFLEEHLTKNQKTALDKMTIRNLLESIGGGSGLSIRSVKPTYYQLQETSQY